MSVSDLTLNAFRFAGFSLELLQCKIVCDVFFTISWCNSVSLLSVFRVKGKCKIAFQFQQLIYIFLVCLWCVSSSLNKVKIICWHQMCFPHLQGGAPCIFTFRPELPSDVNVKATFGNLEPNILEKTSLGYICKIPGL